MAYFRVFLGTFFIHYIVAIPTFGPVNVKLSLKLNVKKPTKVPKICKSQDCIEASKELLNYMDLEADPCSDFFNFTCGNYTKDDLPSNLHYKNALTDMRDNNMLKLKILLEVPINQRDANFMKQTKIYYKSCMDTNSIDKSGLENLIKMLRELGGWPVIEGGSWDEEQNNVTSLMINLQKQGMMALFNFEIKPAIRGYHLIVLDKPELTFSSSSYPIESWLLELLSTFISDMATNIGGLVKDERIINYSKYIVQFEENIIECTKSRPRSLEEKEKWISLDNLNEMFLPVFDFKRFFVSLFGEVNVSIREKEVIAVFSKPYFLCLSSLMLRTPKTRIVNFLLWQMVYHSIIALPTRFAKMENNFEERTGLSSGVPRWSSCAEKVSEDLYRVAAYMFLKKYFNYSTKTKVLQFTNELKMAFKKLISFQKWLEPKTKAEAISKLDYMADEIGYPEHLVDEGLLEELFSKINFTDRPFLEIFYISKALRLKDSMKRLRSSADRTEIGTPITMINAFYQPTRNKIVFPAGIIVPPFYSKSYPMYLNFGGIGNVIGHEISHGFDNSGSLYDKDGLKTDWWQEEDRAKFIESTYCLIDQFNQAAFELTNITEIGNRTLGENMADAGGLRMSFLAYKEWLRKHGEESQLPDIPYNSEQMFFIAYGRVFCGKFSKFATTLLAKEDIHAPGIFRVNEQLKNLRIFSKAFKCKPSSPMNPLKKCRVW